MSGGFFRGTSAEQDTRFSNKQAKLLKSQRFAAELENPVDMTRVKMDVIKPWIATRATELLGFEDEVLINFVYELLDGKEVDGKQIQIQLTGFMEKNTGKFMKELWALLLSAQNNASGVPQQFLDAKEEEMKKKKVESDRITQEIQKRKEKEGREYEQDKQKRMDVEATNPRSANAVSGSSSRYSLPRDSRVQSGMDREMEAVQSLRLNERRTSSPTRSLSKSTSKSGNSKDGRSRSVSLSSQSRGHSVSPRRKNPSSPGRSVSSERRYKSPVQRSISPRRRYSPQRNQSPSRHRSHSRRRSPSIPRHRSPSPMRRRSPYGRSSPSALHHRSPHCRSPIQSRRGSPSPLRQRRSPSPGRRRGSPSTRRRRSPSPRRRRRSPSPSHRRRSPSPSHRRRSPSPSHRRRSPSPSHSRRSPPPSHRRRSPPPAHRRRSPPPAHRRRSPPPAHRRRSPPPPHRRRSPPPARQRRSPARRTISPSPARHRISHSPHDRKNSPSPTHHRISPSRSRRRTSPSPTRRRSPVRNRSSSPARSRSVSPPRRSSPERSLNSSRSYDADPRISSRALKRNQSPCRSSSSSDLVHRDFSRETDSRINGFDTKQYQEEYASGRSNEKRPLVHDALHGEVAERSGSKRGALDQVPPQLACASRSPGPDSRDRNVILDKDHHKPSENSSEPSGSPSYSRRTRSVERDRQPGSTEKQKPRDISRMNGDEERASLARDDAYQRTDSSSKKGKDSSDNMKKKRFHPNEFDEEEYTNNGLAIGHSPGNQGHPSNISSRKDSERKSEVDFPKRHARELSGSGDDMEYGPGKPMSYKEDSHHEVVLVKKSGSHAPNIHSDSEEEEAADTRKHKSGDKRRHKKSDKHRRERDSEDSSETASDIEDKKEAKRRRKEERRLRKEEKRRKREDKHHRKRLHHHLGKHKMKSMDTVTPPSDLDKDYNGSGRLEDETPPRRGSSHASDAEEKKLEIELREKALETLRARKGVGH